MRTWCKCGESQRVGLAKAKTHTHCTSREVSCSVITLSGSLIHSHASFLPAPSATGSPLFLDPLLQMIYVSLYFVPRIPGDSVWQVHHCTSNRMYVLNAKCSDTLRLVITVQLSEQHEEKRDVFGRQGRFIYHVIIIYMYIKCDLS